MCPPSPFACNRLMEKIQAACLSVLPFTVVHTVNLISVIHNSGKLQAFSFSQISGENVLSKPGG